MNSDIIKFTNGKKLNNYLFKNMLLIGKPTDHNMLIYALYLKVLLQAANLKVRKKQS